MEYVNETRICGTLKWKPRTGAGKDGSYAYFGVDVTVEGKKYTAMCAAYTHVADAMEGLHAGDWVDCIGQLGSSKNQDGNWETKLYIKKIGTFPPKHQPSNQTVADDSDLAF